MNGTLDWRRTPEADGAFECGRIYRVYEFRLGNNVRVTYSRVVNS